MSFLAKIFQKKTSGKPPAKQAGTLVARDVFLIQDSDAKFSVGFGLRWRTLLKAGGREASSAMASASKGTHYIHLSHQVGYGIFPKKMLVEAYPAALLVAKINAGVGVFCLEVDQGRYWFCVVRNGVPTATDEIIDFADESQAVSHVRLICEQFSGEQIDIYTDLRNTGLTDAHEFKLVDVFDIPRSDTDVLVEIRKKKTSIPKPIMIAVIVGAGLLLGQKFYKDYQSEQRAKMLSMALNQDEDPEVVWAPIVRAFLAENAKPNNASFELIRRGVVEFPVLWGGWYLQGIRCQSSPLVEGLKPWSCSGSFKRTPIGKTSEEMIRLVKVKNSSYNVSFPDIGSMIIGWSVSSPAQPVSLDDMLPPEEVSIKMLSALQPVIPVLAATPDFRLVPVDLKAPKMSDGRDYPKPDSVPDFLYSDVIVRAPFRSVDYLMGAIPDVDWISFGMTFDEKTSASQRGMTSSSLMVELSGKVLAKKKR